MSLPNRIDKNLELTGFPELIQGVQDQSISYEERTGFWEADAGNPSTFQAQDSRTKPRPGVLR